jgi:hypothetical protein
VLINFSSYITYIIISEEIIYTYTSLGDARRSESVRPKLPNPIDKETIIIVFSLLDYLQIIFH